MKRFLVWFIAAIFAVLVGGCSGGGDGGGFHGGFGDISGVIATVTGNPVRDAKVFVNSGGQYSTLSGPSGTYVLSGIPTGDNVLVQAQVDQDGVTYFGQNLVQVFNGERAKSTNITVGRKDQLASLHGNVADENGRLVAGIRVFALAQSGNNSPALSSSVATSNSKGAYTLSGLLPGVSYTLYANGRNFDADTGQVVLTQRENRRFDFTVLPGTNPLLPAPQNVSAVAWTSPRDITNSKTASSAYEAIKRAYDKKRAKGVEQLLKATTQRLRKDGRGGFFIDTNVEIDVTWDPVLDVSVLGYGVYRGVNNAGFSPLDVVRDPLSGFYADLDDRLNIGTTYSYQITTLNDQYPDTQNSESNPSTSASATPIGQIDIGTVAQNPDRFTWTAASGADHYAVFVYDRFPSVNVDPIWDNSANPTTSTSVNYAGPSLQLGHQYFWAILALGHNNNSRSISPVGEFTAR